MRDYLPHFKVFRLDETEYWNDPDLVKIAGKMWGMYLVDTNEVTHLCELQGSYCLYFIETYPENVPDDDDAREAFLEEIGEVDAYTDSAIYVHTHSIDGLKPVHVYDPVTREEWNDELERHDDDEVETYEYFVEEYLDEVRANVPY